MAMTQTSALVTVNVSGPVNAAQAITQALQVAYGPVAHRGSYEQQVHTYQVDTSAEGHQQATHRSDIPDHMIHVEIIGDRTHQDTRTTYTLTILDTEPSPATLVLQHLQTRFPLIIDVNGESTAHGRERYLLRVWPAREPGP